MFLSCFVNEFSLCSYPASAHRTDQGTFVGCGAHTDYGVLTILLQVRFDFLGLFRIYMQDSVGGLEIESNEGKYVPVPPVEGISHQAGRLYAVSHFSGALVINVGDCVEYLTNGKFRATRHRVSSALPDERSVVVLFYEPSVEMPLKCLPKFALDSTGKQVKTECVTFGEHLRKKLSSTYTI